MTRSKRNVLISMIVIAGIIVMVMLYHIFQYHGWQLIQVEEIGRFYVPSDWVLEQAEDGSYSFTNGASEQNNKEIYLEQIRMGSSGSGNVEYDRICSNSVGYGSYTEDDTTSLLVAFGGRKFTTFCARSDEVTKSVIKKIAKSYSGILEE